MNEREEDFGVRECECYEALDAIENPDVTRFGLMPIYFCERTSDDEFTMIGMPLLEPMEKKFGFDKGRYCNEFFFNINIKKKQIRTLIALKPGQSISDVEAVDIFLLIEYAVSVHF